MEFLITEEAIVGRSSQAVTGRFGCYYMYVHEIRRSVGRSRRGRGRDRTEVRRDVSSQKLRQMLNLQIAKSNHQPTSCIT